MITVLKSRTNWVIAGMFLVGGLNAILPVLPPNAVALVEGLLGLLGVYFKMNPSQKY